MAIAKRLLELLAIAMVGEGAAGLLSPRRYLLIWRIGPAWCRDLIDRLVAQDTRSMRMIFLAELAVGLLISLFLTDEESSEREQARNLTQVE
jgi:hypothetical protein